MGSETQSPPINQIRTSIAQPAINALIKLVLET